MPFSVYIVYLLLARCLAAGSLSLLSVLLKAYFMQAIINFCKKMGGKKWVRKHSQHNEQLYKRLTMEEVAQVVLLVFASLF